MEILSPQLMWINGRCYRVNPTNDDDDEQIATVPEPYIEDGMQCSIIFT